MRTCESVNRILFADKPIKCWWWWFPGFYLPQPPPPPLSRHPYQGGGGRNQKETTETMFLLLALLMATQQWPPWPLIVWPPSPRTVWPSWPLTDEQSFLVQRLLHNVQFAVCQFFICNQQTRHQQPGHYSRHRLANVFAHMTRRVEIRGTGQHEKGNEGTEEE